MRFRRVAPAAIIGTVALVLAALTLASNAMFAALAAIKTIDKLIIFFIQTFSANIEQ